jgi:hypothetical protein
VSIQSLAKIQSNAESPDGPGGVHIAIGMTDVSPNRSHAKKAVDARLKAGQDVHVRS